MLASACAQTIEEKAQVCSACHGEAGIPQEKTTPVIWGQNEGYLYLQLRDFNKGSRKNDQMSPIAADLSKDDMKALAAYFTKLAWPNLQQPSAAKDVSTKALTASADPSAVRAAISISCKVTARRRGWPASRATYLKQTMLAFRDGSRGNNPGMSDLMKAISPGGYRRDLAIRRRPADTRRQQRTLTSASAYFRGEACRERVVRGKVAADFPLLSRKLAFRAATEQQLGGGRVADGGGDHQRRAAAVVGIVDVRTAVDEQRDDFVHIVRCRLPRYNPLPTSTR